MSKRVLYVGPFEFPDKNAAASFATAMSTAIECGGHEVTTAGRPSRDESNGSYHSSYLSATYERCALAAQAGEVDVIISYNTPAPLLARLLMLGRRHKISIVAQCTEWYANRPLLAAARGGFVKELDTALRMRLLQRRCDGLLLSSQYLADYYNGGPPCLVVPTLSALSRPDTADAPHEVPRVVYAGIPFDLRKQVTKPSQLKDRLDIALKLFSEMQRAGVRFAFDVYGLTSEQYLHGLPEHRELVEALDPSVTFHGRAPADTIAQVVANADYSLLIRDPNRVTLAGFPTKFTESVNCGTPAIVTVVGELAEYLEEGVTGYALPTEHVDAVAKLTNLLTLRPEQRHAAKVACRGYEALSARAWAERVGTFIEDLPSKSNNSHRPE